VPLLICVPAGANRQLLDLKVAGSTLAEHVRANYDAHPDLHAHFIDAPGADTAAVDMGGADILLLRTDAWFSASAVRALLELSPSDSAVAFVVSQSDALDADVLDTRVLGVWLPGNVAASLFTSGGLSALDDYLARARVTLDSSRQIDVRVLDALDPPLRIASMADVATVEKRILVRRARAALGDGVRIHDQDSIAIRGELFCGEGVEIDVNVIIEGTVRLADHVKIGANSILIDATIGANTVVHPYSMIDRALVGANSFVGPYGRVRPGSVIGDSVQIGNFVEVKNSEIGSRSRINHLAFVGDATLGQSVTLGAGTITCNHGAAGVARTTIEDGAYIGSGTELVAPLVVGANAVIAAGSTITADAPADKLTIARARQVTIQDWQARGPGPAKE
jgi:NDP-sugar pyrophosphorylase family protein